MGRGADGLAPSKQENRRNTSPAAASVLQDSVSSQDFGKVPKPAWMVYLVDYPDDIKKVWTVMLLNMACNGQTAFGDSTFRHVLTGDEDGIWDDLREAKMNIHAAVHILEVYLDGNLKEPLVDSLAYNKWGGPLMSNLESICLRTVGDSAAGKLRDVDKAISDILLAAQELKWRAESNSTDRSFTYLINAYLHFMMMVCSLWSELECHVSVKAIMCHNSALDIATEVRLEAKLQIVRCLLKAFPHNLVKADSNLKDILNDTVDMYYYVLDLLSQQAEVDLPFDKTARYVAFARFFDAATKLAGTSLSELGVDGTKTSMTEEKWTVAAKEGMVIYMRGEVVSMTVPKDLLERMLDYVIHILATLTLLLPPDGEKRNSAFNSSFMDEKSFHAELAKIYPRKTKDDATTAGPTNSTPMSDLTKQGQPNWGPVPWLRARRAAKEAAFNASQDAALVKAKEGGQSAKAEPAAGLPTGSTMPPGGAQANGTRKALDGLPAKDQGAALPSKHSAVSVGAQGQGNGKALDSAAPKAKGREVATAPDELPSKGKGKGSSKGKGRGGPKAQDAAPVKPGVKDSAEPPATGPSIAQDGAEGRDLKAIAADVEKAIVRGASEEEMNERVRELLGAIFEGDCPKGIGE